MQFALNTAKWAKKAAIDIEEVNRAIIFDLFASVILDTPVMEGRLRGNWLITSDNPASGIVEVSSSSPDTESKSRKDPPRGPVTTYKVNELTSFVNKMDGNDDFNVYLTNNLPYVYRVEYDGWSHAKAPEGMVRKNFIRISSNLA